MTEKHKVLSVRKAVSRIMAAQSESTENGSDSLLMWRKEPSAKITYYFSFFSLMKNQCLLFFFALCFCVCVKLIIRYPGIHSPALAFSAGRNTWTSASRFSFFSVCMFVYTLLWLLHSKIKRKPRQIQPFTSLGLHSPPPGSLHFTNV